MILFILLQIKLKLLFKIVEIQLYAVSLIHFYNLIMGGFLEGSGSVTSKPTANSFLFLMYLIREFVQIIFL